MGWFEATVLGIVQGLTEFLPVSSTAHVLLAGQIFFGHDPEAGFSAVIQLGTMLAVLIYFAKDIGRILKAWFLSLIGKLPRDDSDARLGWFVIVGTIPVAVIGLAFQSAISTTLRSLWVTVTMLLVVGVILLLADLRTSRLSRPSIVDEESARRHLVDGEEDRPTLVRPIRLDAAPVKTSGPAIISITPAMKTLERMTWLDAIIFGLAQACALIPGTSRSGATTAAGLFLGYDRPSAARYSFLLSIPAVWASGLYELKDIGTETIAWAPTLLATGVSFVVGFATIAWLLRFISTHTFRPFAIYRFIIALVVGGLLLTGVISAVGGA